MTESSEEIFVDPCREGLDPVAIAPGSVPLAKLPDRAQTNHV